MILFVPVGIIRKNNNDDNDNKKNNHIINKEIYYNINYNIFNNILNKYTRATHIVLTYNSRSLFQTKKNPLKMEALFL